MPYLDSKIAKKHKAGCKKPKAKRLYIRDYGDKGQQIFIPYGITCLSCKVVILDVKDNKTCYSIDTSTRQSLTSCLHQPRTKPKPTNLCYGPTYPLLAR